MVVGGLLASSSTPAAGQTPLATAPFSGYGSGDVIAINALALGTNQLAGVRAAASGGNVNSGAGGLTARINEFEQNVGPARADRNAYGRGAAVELGLATPIPQLADANQLQISGLTEAYAPPPTDLLRNAIDIPVNPVLFARTGAGEAQAVYDPLYCPVGRPITVGRGFAENLELLGGPPEPDGSITNPLLGTSTTVGTNRATTQSRTVTYVTSNGDGTFGLVAETRQTLAPISVNLGGIQLLIEIAGEFGLRTVATGKPGAPPTGSSVTHLGDPILTISAVLPLGAGTLPVLPAISLSTLIGQGGIGLLPAPLDSLLTLTLGGRPRGLNTGFGTPPQIAPDGTSASGAIDLLRLAVPTLGIDVGLFHMEGQVQVPAGGFRCTIPVSKVASVDPVTVGNDFQYIIKIPSDAAKFAQFFNCDLVGIRAEDRVTTESGNPRIQLLSASNNGVISGNTVTWPNLGNYVIGQEPITLTITARIPPSSGAGVLRDTVDVVASLANCRGSGAAGSDIIQGNATIPGIARLDGSAVTGNVTVVGPTVSRGDLAATGGNSWPLVAGGGFLLAALGMVRLRRRALGVPSQN